MTKLEKMAEDYKKSLEADGNECKIIKIDEEKCEFVANIKFNRDFSFKEFDCKLDAGDE